MISQCGGILTPKEWSKWEMSTQQGTKRPCRQHFRKSAQKCRPNADLNVLVVIRLPHEHTSLHLAENAGPHTLALSESSTEMVRYQISFWVKTWFYNVETFWHQNIGRNEKWAHIKDKNRGVSIFTIQPRKCLANPTFSVGIFGIREMVRYQRWV